VAAEMLLLGHVATDPESARSMATAELDSGRALRKFEEWIAAQGGDSRVIGEPERLPVAPCQQTVAATRAGHIERIDARAFGLACVELGGGRERKDDPIDPSVGLVLHVKVGDAVAQGQPVYTIHARTVASAAVAAQRLAAAIDLSEIEVLPPPLFFDILRG
jgi:thymidine phosphorylase